MSLKLTTAGSTLLFRPSGEVAVLDGQTETVRGAWRASAEPGAKKLNRFSYTLDGEEQPPLPAVYAFSDTNQLTVTLRAADGQSEPGLLPGGIEVDDQHDMIYRLVDDDGTPNGAIVTLYGDLSIEEGTNALLVTLVGGGEARVVGDNGIQSLEAAQNRIAAFAADDLLRFRATTGNTLDNGGFVDVRAKLEFAGSWDVQNGQLVFMSKVTGALSKPDIKIGFAGKLGAITAGFAYYADATTQDVAFQIRGQHVFHSADADTDFNWLVALGFSDKKFSAKVDFETKRLRQNGKRLELGGTLCLKQADGETLDLALSLKAEYQWEDNALVFKALVNSEAGGFNYDLMLQGKFTSTKHALTFGIHFSNAGGASRLEIKLSSSDDRARFRKAVELYLTYKNGQVGFSWAARFSISQRYVSGLGRVLEKVEAA